jgi:2OG-Fe(II) oxygenase superfamily
MKPVRILKNCINIDQAQCIIDYINKNQEYFITGPNKLKFTKMFGKDNLNKRLSEKFIHGIDEIEGTIRTIIDIAIKSIFNEFEENNDLYLAGLWFAKQVPGSAIELHRDIEEGLNAQYKYSVLLYLNTPSESAPLEFPLIELKIMPELGDMVMFKSGDLNCSHNIKYINEDRYSIPMWFTTDKEYALNFAGDIKNTHNS